MGNNDFEINGVVNLSANLNQFSTDMESIKKTYNDSIEEMDSKKISSPINSEETKNSVVSAYEYAMGILGDKVDPNSKFGWGSGLQERITLMDKEFSRIPQALQNAMGGLVTGLHDSIDAISTSLETATKKMSKSFNLDGFTNNIRFAAASAKTYMEDMEAINGIVKRMSPDTKSILEKNVSQISSVVNPAIRKIALSRNDNLSDIDLRHMLMTGKDYSHIPELLKSYGIQANSTGMRDILDFAIKSSSSRIYRRDAAINSDYAGIKTHAAPAVVTDLVSEPYKASLLTAGRFISNETTPRNTQSMDLRRNKEYYDSIKREVKRGNSVAYHAAVDSGLISLNGDGTYSFAQAGQVVKNKRALDQYSALVNQSTSYAAQGSPNHRTNLSDPYDQSRILNRDTVRLKEGTTMISYDKRPDADPYLDPNYQNTITAYDKKHSSIVPKLKIPEMIHIPRMMVRNVNGKHQLMVKDSRVEGGYRPNIDFDWQKHGVEESPDDESITMGRNPLLDALIKMHAGEGAKFEDRTFGWGRDSEGKAKGGVPLMIDMSLDDLYDKNSYGEMLFDEVKDSKGRTIRKSKFGKGNADLIRGLYSGEIKPTLKFPTINADGKEEMKDYTYRVIAGNIKEGGNMKMILQSDYEKLMEESPFLPMLYYFNEAEGKGIDKNAKLINPKTGKAYGNTAKGMEAYTKFFDARNKMLSHSLPIEEMGVDTPLAALVNMEAFYEANNTPKNERFDGGGFIDSKLFTRDFQARMGPAKFLAQRFDWRKWFRDSGFAYKGGEGDNDKAWHMFMPGMSATAEDYKKYRSALQNKVGLNDTSFILNGENIDFGGKTFKDWRNQRFVDVMQSDIGMLLADTTLKAGHKLSSLTPDTYNKIVSEVNKSGYKAPKAMQGRQTSFLVSTNDKNFDKSLLNENGMVSLTPAQQTELMAIMANPDNHFGLRMMKDTENYAGTKNFWSPAYMSSVQMSPKLIAQSMENYRQAYRELSTPQGIIKRMFSGKDADSIRVQNDPTLIQTDRNIQYAIQSEIQDLQEKQLQGYGYFPGTAHMMLATVNPNSVLGVYGENLTGKKLKGPAKELNMGKEGVIAPSLNGKDIYSWTRSPYAPGANFFGSRYARTAANRYGLTGESAMFNVADFYTLNTGDFDGDFVWAYATLEDDKEFVKQTNERNKRLADRAKKREADNKRRQKAMKGMAGENKDAALDFNVDDFALGVLRANDTLNPTGLGYKAGQAGRMVKLSAEDLAYVDDYGNDTYAAAIDMLKHTDVQATAPVNEAVLKAIRSRKPIERLTQALYKEAHNEKYGGTNIFDYGLPTYFDQMGIGLLAGAAEGRLADLAGFGSTIADAIHQNIETRYAGRTKQEKNLADWYGGLLTDKLTGKYQITSAERLAEGDNLVTALETKTKELEKTNPESQEVKDMRALARKAKNAIQTERVAGFSEGTLGDIQKYYDFMGWENPIQKYGLKTELQQSAATILIENERRKQQEQIQERVDQQVDRAIAESSGTTVNPDRRDEYRQRILAANKFTGFNWSNSKHFMDQPLRAQGVRWSTLEGEDKGFIRGSNDGYLVVDFNDSAPTPSGMNVSNREQVARSILTGDTLATRIDADALVGTAAHRYMELYGAYRTSGGVGSKQNKSIQEAKDLAYQGFKESLLGGANGLSEAELAAQRKAGVYFEEDKDGYIVAKLRDEVKDNPYYKETLQRVNEKLQLASRATMNDPKDPRRGKISSLDETAEKYFESAYQGTNGTSHMIMAEGVKFDDKGRQLPSGSKKGNNGIWIIPQRDGEAVVKFQRFKKGSAGNIEESQPGMYFTPDMIKKDEKTGKITITDWKSSEHGQQEAMFQMPFYAHQLEELGKTYHLSGGKRKDLEWFGQFVTQDPFSGKFTSNIEAVQAVNLYAKDKNKAVMSRKYDESIGNYVSRMVEAGMNNLASSAAVGFAAELRESITPRTQGRKADEGRATLGPDQVDKDYSNLGGAENLDDEIQRNIRRYEQIGGGGTGVMDKDGNFIDTDKSYLTARFMKDEETLKNIKSFAGKQSRKINNLRFSQQDEFTQNIDELSALFNQDQFAAIQDYLTKKTNPNFNQYTPDVKMLTKDFDRNQIESMNVMERLMDLRKAYVAQLPETMQLDYDSILYGKGDAMSKLSSAQGKRERDLSALRGVYTNSQYYNSLTGTFKTEAEFYNDLAPELKDGETTRSKSYRDRVKKAKADAKTLAKAATQEEADFTKQANEINNAYSGFSVAWQKEFDKNLEQEFPSLSDLFKNDNLQEAVTKIKQRAEQYKQMANQKQVGGPGGYAYSADERLKLTQAYNKLTARATGFEQLSGSDFAKLLENPKKLEEAKLQSMMTGVSVDYETRRDAELTKFAQAYLAVHPNASAKTVTQNVNRVRARMDQEHKEQTARDNERNIANSMQSSLSLRSEYDGVPVSAEDQAMIQARRLRQKVKDRRSELKTLLKNEKDNDVRQQYQDELDSLKGMTLKGAYSRYLGQTKADENLRKYNISKSETALDRTFGGNAPLSLQEAVDDAIANANAQIEQYIKLAGLDAGEANKVRKRYGNKHNIQREVEEQYSQQLEHERVNAARKEASIQERLTGRKTSSFRQADIAVEAMRSEIHDYRSSLLRRARRKDISDEERNRLTAEAWQYDDRNVDYEGYRDRILRESAREQAQTRRANEVGVRNLTDISNDRRLTAAERSDRRMEDLRHGVRDRISKVYNDFMNGAYTGRENEYANIMRALLNYDYAGAESRIHAEELYSDRSFAAKQESDALRMQSTLENRSLTRDEYTRATQARLRKERDDYLAQQIRDKQMTEAEANAYTARYDDSYLLGIAQQQTEYEYGQRELSLQMEGRNLEATLSGRSLTRDEMIAQRRDQLEQQARAYAEKLRRENRGREATNFLTRYLPNVNRMAQEEVENRLMYGEEANRNQVYAHQIQTDAALRQQQYSAEDFLRQQRNRHIRSAIFSSLQPYRERTISLGRNIQTYEDQRSVAQRELATINRKLADSRTTQEERSKLEAQRDIKTQDIGKYNEQIRAAREEMDSLSSVGTKASAIFMGFGDVLGRIATRLGRQLFSKALNEAKKFVQEFDKSMTTIQMITLKSDSQMSTLGDGLIAKAKELKISISEITQSAETLYRQGLSDEEVNERLDVISKFSKVSGTKVDAATKLITVAVNTGLVSNPETAADIVTALGDNAATNAAEIEKGIEKAGAAAAADGTTFAELAAMLTAITSTTQIGGNVAGRTLNTIFGRMNKIGTNELIYDENGNAVSGSAVSQLLAAQGIRTYDNKGNKRSSYDVLYDLSQKWESLDDATQQQLATQIAGTRQYSNFAAIMQGMAEGKVSEYMSLTESSTGIVDEKYEIYVKSLQASLIDLKNTFDDLIHDLTSSGTLTGIIDTVTNMIQGVDNLTNSVGGLGGALAGILPMLIALAMFKTGMSTGSFGLMAGGLALGIGTGLFLNAKGQEESISATQSLTERKANFSDVQADRNKTIDRAEELYNKGKNRTQDETNELRQLMLQLGEFTGIKVNFDEMTTAADEASNGLSDLTGALSDSTDATSQFAEVIGAARKKVADENAQETVAHSGETATAIAEQIGEFNDSYTPNRLTDFPEVFTVRHDEASGTYVEPSNIGGGINEFIKTSKSKDNELFGANGLGTQIGSAVLPTVTKGLVGEEVSISPQDLAYASNGKTYEQNKDILAGMFASYTTMLGKDSGSPYAGWGKKDWLYEIDRVANGTSSISDEFMTNFSDYYTRLHPDNEAVIAQRSRVRDIFKNALQGDVENEYLDSIVDRAVDEYYSMTPAYDPYVLPEPNDAAIGQIIADIHGVEGPTTNVDADKLKASHKAYAEDERSLRSKVFVYGGNEYVSQSLAKQQQDTDYRQFEEENKINEIERFEFNGKTYKQTEDDEIFKKDFDAALDAYAQDLLSSSKSTKFVLPNGERIDAAQASAEFKAFQEQNKAEEAMLYTYTNIAGKPLSSLSAEELDKERYKDYQTFVTEVANNQGILSNFINDNGAIDMDSLMEWYESQWGAQTYDDYALAHRLGHQQGLTYKGKTYWGPNAQYEIEDQQRIDFYGETPQSEEYYTVNGKTYTDAKTAYEENKDYFREEFNRTHPITKVGSLYRFGEYESTDEALILQAQNAAFYENEANQIKEMAAAEAKAEAAAEEVPASLFGNTVFSYADAWRAEKSGIAKSTANNVYEQLVNQGITSFTGLKELVDTDKLPGWNALISNNPALAEELKKYVVQNEDGSYSIKEGADENFWPEFMKVLAGATKDYTDIDLTTKKQTATNARTAFDLFTEGAAISDLNTVAGREDLKTILGSNLYGKWASGTLSPEEQAYADMLISNYGAGITSLTKNQQLVGIQDVIANIDSLGLEGGYDREIADKYMSQWSDWAEYAALIEAKNAGDEKLFEDLGGQERLDVLNKSLDNFKNNAELKVEIEGLQNLEEAGDLLEGTASQIEKLKKGGRFEIEAIVKITTSAYDRGQQEAKLFSGTESEQDEVAMSLLGMNKEQYYSNRTGNLAWAQSIMTSERDQFINSQNKYYEEIKDTENAQTYLDVMSKHGYTWDEEKQTFVYSGTTGTVDHVSAFVGTQKKYSDAELAAARLGILNGTLTKDTDYELYSAASQSLGAYGTEYMRQLDNNLNPSDRLKELALYESNETLRQQNQASRASAIEYEKAMLATKDVYNASNRSTLAQFLGIDEDRVLELASTVTGESGESNALADMLAEKRNNIVRGIAENLEAEFKDVDLDAATEGLQSLDLGDVTDFDSLVASIRKAAESADEATAKRLNEYADALEGAKGAAETDLSEAFTQAQSRLKENTYEYKGINFMRQAAQNYDATKNGSFIDFAKNFVGPNGEKWDNEWTQAVMGNNGMVAAIQLLSNGTLTNTQFNEFATKQLSGAGKDYDYYDLIAQASMGKNYKNGEFVAEGLRETLETMKNSEDLKGFYDELISKYPQLEEAADGSTVALKNLNEQWKSDKVASAAKYAKGLSNMSDIITNFAKGGNDAKKAALQLDAGFKDLQDRQTAITKARGKSGKELQKAKKKGDQTLDILAGILPYDADQLANMSKEQLDEILNEAQPQIAEDFADSIQSLFSMMPQLDADIDLSDLVVVHADGSIELNDVDNVLTAAEEEILQKILSLCGTYANIDVGALLKGDNITVEAFLNAIRKAGVKTGGGYSRKSSGGGGGGKSAAQQQIDASKHYVAEAQHKVNIAEADLYHPDKINDYDAYGDAIATYLYANEQLAQVQRDQIAALESQRSKVKEGSEDWWSLTEAINGYEEALAKLEQTMDEIEKKMFEELKEQYTYKLANQDHQITMSEIDRTYYQRTNNYEAEAEEIDKNISLKQDKVRTNQEYLAELQGLQDVEYEKNGKSDYWEELQREIESVSETIGNLINDIANLNAEKLNINIEMRNNALVGPQQEAAIMGYDEKILSKQNNYGALLGLYDDTLKNNAKQKEILQKSLKGNEELLATQKYQSDEWYATLKEIYADQTALLELAVSDMETVEKRIDVIIEAYEKVYEELTHRENMLGIEQESLSFTNDYDKYFENLNSYIVEKRQTQDVIESEIKRLEQELTRDDLTEEAKDKIRTRINTKKEELAKIQNDINSVWEKRLSAITEKQEHEITPLEHEITMLGHSERQHTRLNNYEGLVDDIDKTNNAYKNLMATELDQIAELKAEQALVKVGSDAWWALEKRINSLTESYDKNSEAIDENNKKRIKALANKQQIEDRPQEHAFEVLDIAAQRAQLLDDQGMTEGVIADKIQVIKDSVAQNKDQLAEWEDLLKTYVEGSEEWIETRDKIWKTKNDNAKLENQALQLENDLAAKRLANIQKNFKRDTGTATHENTMLDTAGRIYQSYSEYGNYRNVLTGQIADQKKVQDGAIAARDAILAEMATLEKGTPAWYDARDAAYAYDEQIANTAATMLEKQQAIEASRIQEFTENYSDSQIQSNLDLAAVRATRQIMDRNGDWEGYQKAGAQEKSILEQQLADKRTYVDGLKGLLAETTKGTSQWKALRNTIAQELANISNMEAEIDRIDHEQTQSAIDHMLERMNWEDENRKHNLSLIRYEQTKYQNAGELSNYGLMLQKEEELIRASIEAEEDNIKRLKETLSTLEIGTKEYKQIVGEIKKHEEALASDTAELQKNIKEQRENAEAILKTRKDLEDAVDKELRTREEERKKRLDAEVKLQKTILDTIKARYKDQWDLEKKDIDKKKEALEKEKALITERLNARKKAMETEEKYRELEELKRQLALISNDPTRTRDAKELREQINDIEKDLSWEKAFEEAETATQQIDDEIQAMSDYVTVHSDNLEEMLENANNFADQIALIMEGGWDSIADFLTTNNQEFLNSTESARQQMEEGWRETWETMTGYAKTYWDQIAEILSSYENFVAFMKDSTEYLVASDVGKQILEFGWETLYENWKNSGLISDEAENYQTDDHPWTEGIATTTIADILGDAANDWMNLGLDKPDEAVNQMVINTYDDIGLDTKPHAVELTDLETGDTYTGLGITAAQESAAKDDGTSNSTPIVVEEPNLDGEIPEIPKPDLTDKDYEATFNYDYSGVGVQYEEKAPSSYAKVNSEAPKAYTGSLSGSRGSSSSGSGSGNTSSGKVNVIVTAVGGVNAPGATTSYSGSGSTYDAAVEDAKKKVAKGATVTGVKQYATGGLIDYTGPAWVDGTRTKPEAFLSAIDTEMIQSLTKALNFIRIDPWTLPNPDMFANNSSTVGDINITINQAELKDDADYEDVARRVGKAFTKELSKNGFNLTGYNL